MRRLGVVLALVMSAAGAGWIVGGRVRSPAAAAAERRAPLASPIVVPVEKRALSDDLTRRGTVRFDNPTPLSLAGPVGGESGPQVVTKVPTAGDEAAEGAIVLEVNGRPVFALRGAQPTYRSLTPGAKGRDVQRLEEALARLGFDPGAIDGTYDAATQKAVQELYDANGYTAQGPTAAQAAALRDARKAAADGDEQVRQATKALADAGKGPIGADLLALQNDVKQAGQAVDASKLAATRTNVDAAAAVSARAGDVESANAARAAAVDAATQARATHVDPAAMTDPTARPCEVACLARLDADVTARQALVTAALGALESARANVDSAAKSAANDISRAEDQLALGRARLTDATDPKDTSVPATALDAATQVAAQAASELARLEGETGISVPSGELVFLPTLPRRVDEVKAKVGDVAAAGFATVSGSRLAVDSSVELADAGRVRKGTKVDLRLPDIDRHLTGTVEDIAEKPGTNGVGDQQVYLRIVPDDVADATALNGAGVVVTIPIRSTTGDVLVVPLAAVTTRADATSVVTVLDPSGARREVTVKAGLQSGGLVEVAAVGAATLAVGDRVVVGERSAPVAGPDSSDDKAGSSAPTSAPTTASGTSAKTNVGTSHA